MGRYRSRSRSCSPRRRTPSPPRRKRYDEVSDRHRHHYHRRRESSAPSGLLVRNVALHTRPEDLRTPFEKYGPVKDVYLPRNYYTGEPRGFAFVKFRFPEDAAAAKDRLNHTIVDGREIRIVYAEENSKTSQEMRKSTHVSGSYGGRRASSRSPRRRYHSYSRSPASGRRNSRSISRSPSRSGIYTRSTRRSMTPRDHSADGREGRTVGSERSPKEILPRDEKGHKLTKKCRSATEMSTFDENYNVSRNSPSLREMSSRDSKDLRSSGRSISPRKDSILAEDSKEKQRASSGRDVSSPDEDYKKNKSSISPRGTPSRGDSRGTPIHKISSQKDRSPDHKRGHQLKHGSRSPGKNGRRPLHGGSMSPPHSWSYSPHQ